MGEQAIGSGLVFLLEPSTSLIATGTPPKSLGERVEENWANVYFPGLTSVGIELAERIGPKDATLLLNHLEGSKSAASGTSGARRADSSSGFGFMSNFASSFSSVSSFQSQRASTPSSSYQPVDICFIALRGREVRLIIYAVLRCLDERRRASCLNMLSGNVLDGCAGVFSY